MVTVEPHPHQLSSWLLPPNPQPWSQGFWEGDSASLLAQPAWPLTFRAPRLSRPLDCLPGRQWGAPASSLPDAARPCSHSPLGACV